jgi:hypothetical protein
VCYKQFHQGSTETAMSRLKISPRRAIPVADRHGMPLGFESGHDDALGTLGVLPVRSAS